MKRVLKATAFLVLLGLQTSFAQDLKGYVVKKLGNLIILDLGYDAGLRKYSKFDLIKDTDLDLPAAKVTISQIYPDLSVCKVLMEKENIPLNEGDQVVLFASLSDNEIQIPEEPGEEEPARSVIVKPFEWKNEEIKALFQERRKQPFSIILSYVYGYKNIADAISENIRDYTINEIYGDQGTSEISVTGGAGWNFALKRTITRTIALSFDYTRYVVNSEINVENELSSGRFEPLPGTISHWDYSISTKINNISVSLDYGNFGKISEYFSTRIRKGGLIYHIGAGVDYMSVSGSLDQIITTKTIFYRDYESFNRVEKFNNPGYWGGHISAGISYFVPVFRVFLEASYIKWGSTAFTPSFPVKAGFEIFF